MTGRYLITRDETGTYRFALVAANGQTVAAGEGFATKAACVNGIESVRRIAPDAPIEDRTHLAV
ncbi:hypothetical protein GCM10010149_05640 [Nonomuraea roseoviolacea subsp. roseoviolacea]|uniref:Uncharacterized protein YegP (UPF0339 family) n=1 Tax=Nonomuraea roseoviolacea subsp. carminata TaxID=160689 RepID=A0ABT1K5E6_9ACTN|nr:DUF1508 domain-containing protein [Nonomuraea roseoviolacea]MCP2349229.1 uncharacterized protein YegP (UPF0339 family) [Nonomuraea roseoviolacea subsp. carminata]